MRPPRTLVQYLPSDVVVWVDRVSGSTSIEDVERRSFLAIAHLLDHVAAGLADGSAPTAGRLTAYLEVILDVRAAAKDGFERPVL